MRLSWDVPCLVRAVEAYRREDWVPIRSGGVEYETGWMLLPLRSRGGDPRDGSSGDVGDRPYEDTPLLMRAPYFEQVLYDFACELRAVRLSALRPGARIAPHADREVRLEKGRPIRLHVPIVLGDTSLFVAGHEMRWDAGELWYADFGLTHSAANYGAETRVHLLVVAVVNDWLLSLFPDYSG